MSVDNNEISGGKEPGMEHSDQSHQPRTANSGRPDGEVRRRVLKIGERSEPANNSHPLSGATGAEQASAAQLDKALREARWAPGARIAAGGDDDSKAVFVIAKKYIDFLDTPVFYAGESGGKEAVALFTDRQRAQQYLDRAGWGQTDEIGKLSPSDLLQWLVEANKDGVRYATVNPDQDRHLAGDPQPVLPLDALGDKSPDELFQEVTDLERG